MKGSNDALIHLSDLLFVVQIDINLRNVTGRVMFWLSNSVIVLLGPYVSVPARKGPDPAARFFTSGKEIPVSGHQCAGASLRHGSLHLDLSYCFV